MQHFGEYGGCGRGSSPKDLFFLFLFVLSRSMCSCIVMLENNTSVYQIRALPTLSDEVAGNKRLQ